MTKLALMPNIGAVIAGIGTPGLAPELAGLIREVAPYTYTVIFGYRGNARPLDLFDDFPAGKRGIFVTDYQDGPYLLDPFFLAANRRPVLSGLFRMRDLAPDRFYQGEYFRNYYVQTGLAEEIAFFVDLPQGITVVLSLMREDKPFSPRDFRNLQNLHPVVDACLRRHWVDLADRLSVQQSTRDTTLKSPVERSFQHFGQGILTPREREVVEHTLKGHSAEATGQILTISPGTVRIHRRNIYAKLRISSQGELFSKFIQTLATT